MSKDFADFKKMYQSELSDIHAQIEIADTFTKAELIRKEKMIIAVLDILEKYHSWASN